MTPKLTEFEGIDDEEILQIFKLLWNLAQLALRHNWANVDHIVLCMSSWRRPKHATKALRKLQARQMALKLANDDAQSQSGSNLGCHATGTAGT
jgi:hypothetical protein